MQGKKKVRKRLIIEGLMTLLIALSPVLFYSHKYVPSDTETLDLFFFEISSNGFYDAQTALWFYLIKIIPLTLLVIWFVTNKQWWYHALLIPISMYSFQLFTQFYSSDSQTVDENEIFYVIAVTMVVVPVVYFIRVKLIDKHVHGIDLDAMDTELQILKEKEELRKEREKLEQRQKTLAKKV